MVRIGLPWIPIPNRNGTSETYHHNLRFCAVILVRAILLDLRNRKAEGQFAKLKLSICSLRIYIYMTHDKWYMILYMEHVLRMDKILNHLVYGLSNYYTTICRISMVTNNYRGLCRIFRPQHHGLNPTTCYRLVDAFDELEFCLPIGSMYGIYANIGGILMVNVTIYSIRGSYGLYLITTIPRIFQTYHAACCIFYPPLNIWKDVDSPLCAYFFPEKLRRVFNIYIIYEITLGPLANHHYDIVIHICYMRIKSMINVENVWTYHANQT